MVNILVPMVAVSKIMIIADCNADALLKPPCVAVTERAELKPKAAPSVIAKRHALMALALQRVSLSTVAHCTFLSSARMELVLQTAQVAAHSALRTPNNAASQVGVAPHAKLSTAN